MRSCPVCNTSFDGGSCETCGTPAEIGDDAGRWYEIGRDHWNAGRHGWAARCLERTVAIDPSLVKGWVALGIARRDAGEFLSAIESFDRAIAMDPAEDKAYYNKAMTLESHSIHRDALMVLDAGLERRPGSLVLLLEKADLLAKVERYEESLDTYDSALRVNPQYKVTMHARQRVVEMLEKQRQREQRGGLFRRRERAPAEASTSQRDPDPGSASPEGGGQVPPSGADGPATDGGDRTQPAPPGDGPRGPDAANRPDERRDDGRDGGRPDPAAKGRAWRPPWRKREANDLQDGREGSDEERGRGLSRRD
ncbi:MAG: tetratricopeptide repeat protein [Thermoplasmata archaeon]|nr:tetratricopeptide repeat protein [Thermoplasmata archaeon]